MSSRKHLRSECGPLIEPEKAIGIKDFFLGTGSVK